ncbi:Crp/Fnr family transcriptional regulator [Sphingomonas sp. LaA6.9]|uniref:Crp/Fnr family transcriptional regulator n=1 Tax=Sphingomonas sp. LaA6.9 TaxID=2919914 RepID=UPI001F4F76FF|nr:Crp/Fnr family transcriptional regulator [Sphingomonas sp. LaA6.9]MCJ8156616.1 Crp/Fnr family transcriptional regulator [Sphingomonas sp. LaA6.9]
MNENPLVTKLGNFVDLQADDLQLIRAWSLPAIRLATGTTFIAEGDRPERICLLLEGWGYRYKTLRDGNRQILAFLLPGDMCDLHAFILSKADHDIAMLTDATVAFVSGKDVMQAVDSHPRLTRALWWSTLVDEGIAREWIVNLGRRRAVHRVAHLFCELWLRLRMLGMTSDGEFLFPLSQEVLSDAVAMTPVHVNRMLRELRERNLLEFRDKHVAIPDVGRLMSFVDFDPSYLQLERRDLSGDLRHLRS